MKVWADSPVNAGWLADAAFKGKEMPKDVEGEIIAPVRDRDLVIREDY